MTKAGRVLMTTDTVGGVWQYALELARALDRRGVTTILAAMGRPMSADQRAEAGAIQRLMVEEGPYRLEWMADAAADVEAAGDWLLALEREYEPDAVHLNGYAHGTLPWRAGCMVVAHSCVRSWWQSVHGTGAPAEWTDYGRWVEHGLAGADMVVAPTVAFLRQIEKLYRPLPKARVIWNGRDPQAFRPAATKEPFVFSAGRLWDEAKNVAALAEIAPELDWPVVVAGDWRSPDGRGAPPAGLRCLGQIDPAAMADWMGRAAVFALPARYEPFGLAALEAGLSGCALVLGDIPTLRELWTGAALFVDPNDRRALHAALANLQQNPAQAAALGAAARKRALAFTAERTASAYCDAYARLAGRTERRRADPRSLFAVHS